MEHVTATAAVEASEDDSGPSSSFSLLEYEKASKHASKHCSGTFHMMHLPWCISCQLLPP
ncbi:unnamed protein product, partial [Sphagnum jensenii]